MGSVGESAAVPQEAIELDLRAMLRGAIRASLEVFLQEELTALVGAERYGRVGGRRDRRNGAYERRLLPSLMWLLRSEHRGAGARGPSGVRAAAACGGSGPSPRRARGA